MDRRNFLRTLLAGAAVGAAGLAMPQLIIEPRRKVWAVSRSAPIDAWIAAEDVSLLQGVSRLSFVRPSGEQFVVSVTEEALEQRWSGDARWASQLPPDIRRPLIEWADTLPAANDYKRAFVLHPIDPALRRAYLEGDWHYPGKPA